MAWRGLFQGLPLCPEGQECDYPAIAKIMGVAQ